MPRQFITAARVRSIIAGANTEPEVVAALRRHGIRYSYSTETGYLHIRIPCRTGCLRIVREYHPLRTSGGRYPLPILHPDH